MSIWRTSLDTLRVGAKLASWLREPGSLTARCQRVCGSFRVRLLICRQGKPIFLDIDAGHALVREVLLECDGSPVIFAHTELSTRPRGLLAIWLRRLGNRSLGSLLFSSPRFRRGTIEYCRLDPRHRLFRRAVQAAQLPEARELWARRCWHVMGRQRVLVTEVFLPVIIDLHEMS